MRVYAWDARGISICMEYGWNMHGICTENQCMAMHISMYISA